MLLEVDGRVIDLTLHLYRRSKARRYSVHGRIEVDLIIGGEDGDDWRDQFAEQHQKSATSAFSRHL
ncbi:hypothetical protein N7481_007040 [Penicillium waksmanii]|uniref:uncharacterized protein n=1 Tax=Penicillium waksmanii TaxID=69791 RepID=UPI002548F2B6|nr:uncharacterized protein N7481_007040 [Penicillium waksmanii]KAJ5979742.1 hypothetical protein N7481_007040 [Penicillium waksmanii]